MYQDEVDQLISTLPSGWHHRDGLRYPMTLNLLSGKVEIPSYKAHYAIIQKLFVK